MPVKQVLDGNAAPVKIWTDDIDEGSITRKGQRGPTRRRSRPS